MFSDTLPLVKTEIFTADGSIKKIIQLLGDTNIYSVKVVYENPELADYILERNLQNTFDEHGYTPLMACIKFDCISAFKKLLKNGADPNCYKDGMTALLLATYKYCQLPNDLNEGIIQTLLFYQADPFIKDSTGECPYDLWKKMGADTLAKFWVDGP